MMAPQTASSHGRGESRGGRGGRRPRRGGRPDGRGIPSSKAKSAISHLGPSADVTPALSPGQMTPAPVGITASSATTTRFADFPELSAELLQNIPFEFCTEVQAATLPSIIENHDVLAQAKTGMGKTLAFLVPSIQRLISSRTAPQAQFTSILVLSPTRELAQQIGVAAEGLLGDGKGRFGVQCVVGGTNIDKDKRNLQNKRADILVATPGRLVDLLENSDMGSRLSQVRTLVLDEADRLLDAGFRRELLKILNSLPDRAQVARQTLLFSATLPAEVHSISSIALRADHRFISTLKDEDVNAHKHVIQECLVVPAADLIASTVEVLRREEALSSQRGGFKVMVFLPTARAAGVYHDIFAALPTNYPVWQIHSRMSQSKRTKATEEFRAAESGVLFSSDVTARGIDVQGVTGVVQVGLPSSGEQYVHRLGRTARAGAQGHGVLILGDFEVFFLNDKTIKTFTLHEYPALDSSSLAQAHALVNGALNNVSEESKGQAYQAWLGYYNSNLRALKWSQADLVSHANDFARQCLHTRSDSGSEWRPPGLLAKTVGKMGLKGIPGLNIVRGEAGTGRNGHATPKPNNQQSQQPQQPYSQTPRNNQSETPRGAQGPRRGRGRGRGRGL